MDALKKKLRKTLSKRAYRLAELRWRLCVSYDDLWAALASMKDEVDVVQVKKRFPVIMVRSTKRMQ